MDCCYLPDRDRRPWAWSRMVMDDPDNPGAEECEPLGESSDLVVPPVQSGETAALRVNIVQSPVLHTFYHQHPVQLTLNTGATSSTQLYGFPISPASQMAHQADGVTPMDVIGEVHCSGTRGQWIFVYIMAGNPFMVRNDIGVHPAKRQTEIGGIEIMSYSSPSRHTRQPNVRRTQSFLLNKPNRTVVLPGEYIQFITLLEPRPDYPSYSQRKPEDAWPLPQQIQSVDYAVCIPNTIDSPILLKNGKHLCQVRHVLPVEASISTSPPNTCGAASSSPTTCKPFSSRVILVPDRTLVKNSKLSTWSLMMCSTPASVDTMVQVAKLRPLSTSAPPFLLSEKEGFPSTTGTPLRNYKTSLMSSKVRASLQNLSMWST